MFYFKPLHPSLKRSQGPPWRNLLVLSCLFLLVPGILAAAPVAAIRVDQVGYLANETKLAMVLSAGATGPFDVRRTSDNASVFTGTLGAAFTDTDSGDNLRVADFSALVTGGAYYLDVTGVGTSYPFDIGSNVFANTYVTAMRAFYGQRCGIAVNLGTVDGVNYSYPICHASGAATDLPSTYHSSSGLTGTKNTAKGWHDAGDFGKYIVNSGITTGEVLWTYEFFPAQIGSINLGIPESGNAVPDILDEARWNLEWMLTMQDADGGVWHKNTSAGFGGMTLPHLDTAGIRYIIGTGPGAGAAPYKTSCSTADFAAVMAIAGRVYQGVDAAFANACLNAAQRAWTWVSANPAITYTQPTGISTGGYGDNNCADERYWAAAELWRTTGSAAYNTFITGNTPAGTLLSPTAMPGWPNVRYLGYWTYFFSTGGDAGIKTRIQNDTNTAAISIAARTNGTGNGYRVSLMSNQYIWGSNGDVGNYGLYLTVANRMTPNPVLVTAALNDLHYLLGRNTHSRSFVTHVGDNYPMRPHHRPSGSPTYNAGAPWPGLLVGGPCSSTTSCNDGNNSPVTAIPASPPAKRWVDHQNSYSTNENAINWQSSLVFLLASTVNGAPPTPTFTPLASTPTRTATPSPTPTRTNTPSVTPTRTSTPSSTPTSTASRTATASSTNTPLANTPTSTSTRTNTPSSTPTSTASRTATASSTSTLPVNTVTSTATLTRTSTPSSTPTSTVSRTATPSSTSTPPLNTVTPTFTRTSTVSPTFTDTGAPTATRTGTPSSTPTSTASGTATPTLTRTPTASSTLTASPTFTDTGAPTATRTGTPSSTPTSTASGTATPTLTRTLTASPTFTDTGAPTATRTDTSSPTPSSTRTLTPSSTPTRTASPSSTATATASASWTPTSTDSSTLTATASPTPTATASRTATSSSTATISPTPTDTGAPTATASSTPTGTPSATASRTATSSSTATASASRTPTASATVPATSTRTSSATTTGTVTPTSTSSLSFTPTAIPTGTPTSTPAFSPSPVVVPGTTPIVIPNPVVGPTVLVLPQSHAGTSEIKAQVYTASFKLVLTKTFPAQPSGSFVALDLTDDWGESLANGLYYIVLTIGRDRATAKLVLAP